MILRDLSIVLSALFFFHASICADYFTVQEAVDYHQRGLVQWNVAQSAIHDHPFFGDERVLDIGCGDGKITAYIAQQL